MRVYECPAQILRPDIDPARRVLVVSDIHANIPYFDGVLSADELKLTKREHPIFERALEILGTKKENTWGFDDTAYALQTLNSVGCHTIGIYSSDLNGTVERLRADSEFTFPGGLEELGSKGFLELAI